MDAVLEILNNRVEEILIELRNAQNDVINWKEFVKSKSSNIGIEITSNSNKINELFESNANKSLIDNIVEIISKTNFELYSSELVKILKPIYEDKDKDFIQRRISTELSDGAREGILYSRHRKDENQHHLAKVWGLVRFLDENKNVKEEHKYKSTH